MNGDLRVWAISPEERNKHDKQFDTLSPTMGYVSGERARKFFLQSGLPPSVLAEIWALADMGKDGKMDRLEFSISMKLIKLKLQGTPLLSTLPIIMKQPPVPALNPSSTDAMSASRYGMGAEPNLSMMPGGIAMLTPNLSPMTPMSGLTPMIPTATGMVPLVSTSTMPIPLLPSLGSPALPNGTMGILQQFPPGYMGTGMSLSAPYVSSPLGLSAPYVSSPLGLSAPYVSSPLGLSAPYVSSPLGLSAPYVSSPLGLSAPYVSSPLSLSPGINKATSLLDSSSSNSSSTTSLAGSSPKTAPSDWAVPHASRLKYRQQFNSLDKHMTGYLTGPQVRNAMATTLLTHTQLATIWSLADVDKDGTLRGEEFILAMHLVDVAKSGRPLPHTLPTDLIPPSERGSVNGTSLSLYAGITEELEAEPPQKTKNNLSFEDKFKANLERGNAELEKRRQALQDAQRREEEKLQQKEREERERREREVREQEERRRKEEERRMERQRELERQKEEERLKEMERKEAAQRELELQRKEELERRRRGELQRQKSQEQEDVSQLKARKRSLEMELEAVGNEHRQISERLRDAQSRRKVQRSELELANQRRDTARQDINSLQRQLEENQRNLSRLTPEQQRLSDKLKDMALNNLPVSTTSTLKRSTSEKAGACRDLKQQLDALEMETAAKLADMDHYLKDIQALRENQRKQQSALDKLRSIEEDKGRELERQRELEERKRREEEEERKRREEKEEAKRRIKLQEKLKREEEERQRRLQEEREAKLREEEERQRRLQEEREAKLREEEERQRRLQEEREAKLREEEERQRRLQEERGAKLREEEERQRRLQEEREAKLREEEEKETQARLLAAKEKVERESREERRRQEEEERKRREEERRQEEEERKREEERRQEEEERKRREEREEEEEKKRQEEVESKRCEEDKKRLKRKDEERRRRQQEEEARKLKEEAKRKLEEERRSRKGEVAALRQQGRAGKTDIHDKLSALLGGLEERKGGLKPQATEHRKSAMLTSFRALYPFTARNLEELSFEADEVIEVDESTEREQGWLYGSRQGKMGWFPESYVERQFKSERPATVTTTTTAGATTAVYAAKQALRPQLSTPINTGKPGGDASMSTGQNSAFTPTHAPHPTPSEQVVGNLQAQALCSWTAKTESHLNFSKDDVIRVLEQQDSWWLGELNGVQGWFPKTYVTLLGDNDNTTALTYSPPDEVEASDAAPLEEYMALYTYESPEHGDLTFREGDVILVTQREGEWWSGGIGDRTGVFPSNYVKPKETDTSSSPGKPGKKPELAQVSTAFTATGTEQLSLVPGQRILILSKDSSGWLLGELQARGKKRQKGWFPASHVKMLGSNSGRSTPAPLPVCQVIAVYDYKAANEDEMSFSKGQMISVFDKNDPDWWKGEINGITGLFPTNYVKMTTVDSDPSQQWCADLNSLESMSPEERKRQGYIHELLQTEERYVEDLQIVMEVFHKPMSESGRLTEAEMVMIFVNWKELIACNTKLLKALQVRKKTGGVNMPVQVIGDILASELPHLQPYIQFCSCQLNGATLLQSRTDNQQDFKDFLKKIATDYRCKGMPLSSFLLKPMQRITRYPLHIKNILESTKEEHADCGPLREALERAEELCTQVNEGVREKENCDRLEWIQSHVQCEGVTENLVFNSLTNCLGPRKLLHSGKVYKMKGNKELWAFLFNDFLLLTHAARQFSSSGLDKLFTSKNNTQLKMYKPPVFLNEILVKLPDSSSEEPFFHISNIDRVYSLKTENINERTAWVQKIKAACEDFFQMDKKKRAKAYQARSLKASGIGCLLVTVLGATELKSSKPNGKSNPYCEVTMGAQNYTSKTLSDTVNPKWNFNCQFNIRDLYQEVLCITIFQREQFSPDDFLGRTEVPVATIKEELENKGLVTRRLPLHEVPTGEVWVCLDLQLFQNSASKQGHPGQH